MIKFVGKGFFSLLFEYGVCAFLVLGQHFQRPERGKNHFRIVCVVLVDGSQAAQTARGDTQGPFAGFGHNSHKVGVRWK